MTISAPPTAAAVVLELPRPRRAGFWIRVLAVVIDLVPAIVLFIGAATFVTFAWGSAGGRDVEARIGEVLGDAAVLLYMSLEIWIAGTLGKRLLGLRIAAADGLPADRWRLMLRWSTKQFPLLCALLFAATRFPLLYVIGGFTNLFVVIGCLFASNDDHLTWHDQWAGTSVVHLRPAPSAARGFAVIAEEAQSRA